MTAPARPSGPARTLLTVAAIIAAAEASVFLVLAFLDLSNLSGDRLGLGLGTGVFLAVYGVGIAWAAWRITRGDAWARGPLVLSQLIQLGIAWNLRDPDPRLTDTRWVAALLAVASITVLVCLLSPPVTRALSDDEPL